MRHFAVDRRGLLAIGGVLLAGVVASAIAWGGDDRERTPGERARLVLREAAERQRRGCHERPGFTVYTLGAEFRREHATRLGARCETHADEVEVFYGPCRDGGESGCGNDISVRSRAVCRRPSELYTIFNGPSGGDFHRPRAVTTLRGVPAAVFEEQIELVTRDTAITIFADPDIAREAVDALRPAARATATRGPLPKPAAAVVGGKLGDLRCPGG